jgi:hypothetical protein
MQYLVAIAIIVVFLAIWVGVDALSRKRGLTNPDKPRTTCQDCQCGGNDTCQIQDKKESGS